MDDWNNKQKIVVKIICILLSIGLWFYVTNVENPIMSEDINRIPVRLINDEVLKESNLILSPGQQFYVNMKVEGAVQDLRKIEKSDFEVIIDLSEYAFKIGNNKIPVNIIDSPPRIAIKNNSSLTLEIKIEEYVEKQFNITSGIDIIAKPTYYVSPIEFTNKEIKVFGPKSLVDRVESVIAKGEEYNVSDNITRNYDLIAVDENNELVQGVELSQNSVEATIKVNEGKVVPIKVNTIGEVKEGVRLNSILQSHKEVELSGPKDILDQIEEIQTESINLSNINENISLEVKLISPSDVQLNLGQLKTIKVDISIDKQQNKELTTIVNFIGLGEGLRVTPINNSINIKVSGYLENIDGLNNESITATIDLSKYLEEGEFTETPEVILVNNNENVKIEILDTVKFKIEKTEIKPEE